MKFDALHNKQFLETMFNPGCDSTDRAAAVTTEACRESPKLPKLRELYHLVKVLFEYVLILSNLR